MKSDPQPGRVCSKYLPSRTVTGHFRHVWGHRVSICVQVHYCMVRFCPHPIRRSGSLFSSKLFHFTTGIRAVNCNQSATYNPKSLFLHLVLAPPQLSFPRCGDCRSSILALLLDGNEPGNLFFLPREVNVVECSV